MGIATAIPNPNAASYRVMDEARPPLEAPTMMESAVGKERVTYSHVSGQNYCRTTLVLTSHPERLFNAHRWPVFATSSVFCRYSARL